MKNDTEHPYDICLDWALLKECNFSCEYCIANSCKGTPKEVDIPRIVERLNRLNKTMFITFSGGEPFLVPNFTELVMELSKKHYIRVDTNLSLQKQCEKFMNMTDPARVIEITFSVHILEREKRHLKLEDLCALVKRFQEKGFNMVGNYVVHPLLLERFEKDMQYFAREGIKVLPTFFVGKYKGTDYPMHNNKATYSGEYLNKILAMNPLAKGMIVNPKGRPCQAGSAAFCVTQEYKVVTCVRIPKKIGDFFGKWKTYPKVIRCPMNFCSCPFNKPFAASPATSYNSTLLEKTLKEKGVASMAESYRLTASFAQLLRMIFLPILNFFHIRKYIALLKNMLTKSKE